MSLDIPNLESFLFTEKKEDFIKKLVSGTDSFYYYSLTNSLNQQGLQLSKEQLSLLEEYKLQNTSGSKIIELRSLLLKLEKATTEEEKKDFLLQIKNCVQSTTYNISCQNKYQGYSFSHVQPVIATGMNFESDQQKSNNDSLDRDLLSYKTILNVSDIEHKICQIDEHLLSQIDLKELGKEPVRVIQSFIQKLKVSLGLIKGVPQLLKIYYDQAKQIPQDAIKYLTAKQIEEFVGLVPNIVTNKEFLLSYLLKEFKLDFSFAERFSGVHSYGKNEEKKKIFQQILEWAKKLSIRCQSLEDKVIKMILTLGIQDNHYDFDLFVQFLKEPGFSYRNFNESQINRYQQRQQKGQDNIHNFDSIFKLLGVSSNLTDEQLIEKFSTKYIQLNEKYDILIPYFNETFLKKSLLKIQLQKGKSVERITEHFSAPQIQSFTDKKCIKICEHNKKLFKDGEDVKIDVVLKNIPQLSVQLFEFKTENYYKKNLKELDKDIELDGLIASEESSFQFDNPPIQKFTQTFKFDSISKKQQGVFIIDFQGNGVSSRSIIQKGCLVLKEKKTIAGQAFQILNENLEICKGSKTGIFFQRKFYPLNSDDEVIIPFTDSAITDKAILVIFIFIINKNITQTTINRFMMTLVALQVSLHQQNFKCAYLYNTQSMLMSSKGKVLVQPRLYFNDQAAPLSLLKDSKIVVTTVNQMGISSSTTFNKIEFNHKQEVEVEFPVAPKKTQVKTMTQGEKAQSSSHTISFNSHQSESSFCIQNLRYTKSGYEIYLIGQNGEPKPNINININFQLRGYATQVNTTLTTNQEGYVKLFELENVLSLTSSVEPQGDISASTKAWTIENTNQISYQTDVQITQNDPIKLPYIKNKADSNLNLIRVMQFPTEECPTFSDETSRIKVENHTIMIDPLPAGVYKLLMRDSGQAIKIKVVQESNIAIININYKGTYWKNTHCIQTERGLIDQQRNAHILVIENVQVETPQGDDSGNTLKIKLYSDHKELARVHIIAYHYLPGDFNQIVETMNEIQIPKNSNFISTSKAQNSNSYKSNKKIGDEVRYALERKRHQRYIGNTLDKPHLLLKRTFVRDTSYETESVSTGGGYQQSSQLHNDLMDELDKQITSLDRVTCKKKYCDVNSYGISFPSSNDYQMVDSFNNFLLNPALVISNLKPDENGDITVKNLSLSKFSTVQVIATDLYNNITKVIPLDKNTIEMRNLCQRVNQQKDKFFTISRTNEYIQKSSEFKSQDFTSTELQLIDSIPKLFATQKELRRIHGTDSEQSEGYDFWDFLPKWSGYTLEEKHRKYDKFSCHELNLFIFCKDPPFFNDFVKPFIQNKIEKTFIDRFLVNDVDYLIKQSSASAISQLNALEIVLLIFFLKQTNKTEDAKGLFNYLESSNKIKKYDTSQFKKLFDTVLNAKTESDSEDPFSSSIQDNNLNNQIGGFNFGQANPMMQQAYMPQVQNLEFQFNYANNTNNFDVFDIQPQQYMAQQQMDRFSNPYQDFSRQAAYGYGTEQLNYGKANEGFFDFDDFGGGEKYEKKRGGFIQQYQNLDTTKEYCERHYYSQTELASQTSLVPINNFWVDLARHIITYGQDKPFLSSNFIYSTTNHTQMISALSFLALPFENQSHNYEPYEGKGIKITMNSNCIVFAKQIKEGQAQIREDILITQKFFDPNDRYVFSDENPDDKYEKQISEYIIDKKYGCQVIVTNCSAARHELQVFVEIPSGSIPVYTIDYTKTHNIVLEPFQTKPIEYFFYFPKNGLQEIYPCNVAKSGQIVAFAKAATFDVKEKRTSSNLETINEILQKGSKEDILNFVQNKNILNNNIFQFSEIFYLLRDKVFYQKFIEILKNRKIFDLTTWSYSIFHNDVPTFIEFIMSNDVLNTLKQYVNYFSSSLFNIDSNRFYEYYPLSNPRVHMLHSDKSNILNREFKERYTNFLSYLVQKPQLTVSDRLGLVYYFLLQDRIEEAIQIYKQIDSSHVSSSPNCKLQYDYYTCYLDFFIGFPNFKKARELCEKYLDYPVFQWRNLFYEVANKLAEYDGEENLQDSQTELSEEEIQQQKLKKTKQKKEEMNEVLKVELSHTKLDVTIQNIPQLTVNYYLIDLEILFSRNPFLSKENSDFSFIKPNHTETYNYDISKGLQKVDIQIPEKYHKSNVCVELSSPNTQRSVTYFSTSLQVSVIEDIGQIKVLDKDEKPLSKVYVKCFSKKKDGTVSFYKDGYTDLVGRFDYTSRNSSNVSNIQTFSIFIMSDELGAIIKDANPPSQVGQIVEEVKLKGTNWNKRADVRNRDQIESYASHQIQQKACKNAFI